MYITASLYYYIHLTDMIADAIFETYSTLWFYIDSYLYSPHFSLNLDILYTHWDFKSHPRGFVIS